jgi:hypothetical protein
MNNLGFQLFLVILTSPRRFWQHWDSSFLSLYRPSVDKIAYTVSEYLHTQSILFTSFTPPVLLTFLSPFFYGCFFLLFHVAFLVSSSILPSYPPPPISTSSRSPTSSQIEVTTEIPHLRPRLLKILQQYSFEVSLNSTCNSSLEDDTLSALQALNQGRRRAVKVFKMTVVMIMMRFNDDNINGTMMKFSNVSFTVDAIEKDKKCTEL